MGSAIDGFIWDLPVKNTEDIGISDAVITTTGVLVAAVVTAMFSAVIVEGPQALCCLLRAASAAISLGVFVVAVTTLAPP